MREVSVTSEGGDGDAAVAAAAAPTVPFQRASEADLGKVWRCEKLRDFEWRMRCLGLDSNPEAQSLLQAMLASTEELNRVGDALARGEVEPKWWWNGEYDRDRAEESNDRGAAAFKAKRYGDAFDSFTDAIQLWPSRFVYHANRASAALKLGRYDVCASDCEEALAIQPTNLKVLIRCATALQALGRPAEASKYWRRVLAEDAGNAKGEAGLRRCCEEEATQEAKKEAEAAKSQAGSRTELPRTGVSDDWNDRLYACREMTKYEQSLSADLSVIEALIMCRRYPDALTSLRGMPESTETLYLTAEAQWRSGDVSAALAILSSMADGGCGQVRKCAELQRYLEGIHALAEEGRAAAAEEVHALVVESCESIEKLIEPKACSGLYASVLKAKAGALMSRGGRGEAALAALDAGLEWEPEHEGLLSARARVKQQMGNYHGALSDLSLLQALNPATPGLFRRMQNLACAILETKDPSCRAASVKRRVGFDPFAVLEVPADADDLAIRRSYRRLAGQWHPDKWAQKTEEQQEAASVRFKEIKSAYECLTTPQD